MILIKSLKVYHSEYFVLLSLDQCKMLLQLTINSTNITCPLKKVYFGTERKEGKDG